MRRVFYELYDPCLTINQNAEKLGCSVVALKKHLRNKCIDRKFGRQYVRWKQMQFFFHINPNITLKQASLKLGCSINTICKYNKLTEEELFVSKRNMEKVTSFVRKRIHPFIF